MPAVVGGAVRDRRSRARSRPLIFLLVLLSVTLIAIDQAGDSAPTHVVRSALRDSSGWVVDSVDSLWPFGSGASVKQLTQQNVDLRRQLDQAQGQLAQVSDAARQRNELLALNGLITPDNVGKVIAPITAIGASNFDDTIELGKGSDQGIATGMPVVSDKGLIGRVVQTSSSHSTVLLLQDTTSNVGVRLPTGDIAVGVGDGLGKPMRLELVDLTSQAKVGDVAVTSGEDHSLFPPGLPVGVVSSVNAGAQDLRKDVKLTPIVNVHQLGDVAVLQWKS